MAEQPQNSDLESWHKYFAIEANNRSWGLVETEQRTEEENREMLNLAHVSVFHWSKAGAELNQMRAKMLLAEVYAQLGFGETGLVLAKDVQSFFQNIETPDWELALVHTIYAHAAYVAENDELYTKSYSRAFEAVNKIVNPADKEIVLKTFNQLSKP